MPETLQGKLSWSIGKDKTRSWQMSWTSKTGKALTSRPRYGTLADELLTAADNDIAVDYELSPDGSYPINIRPAGKPWIARQPANPPRAAAPIAGRQGDKPAAARMGHFHNPYNFIPAVLPKSGSSPRDRGLGHANPVGHEAWYDGYFSGRLTVDITVKTPLLVPDASRARKLGDHLILPLLTEGNDGKTPKLPVTSFKGALRSAYEAITNSRLGIFQGHHDPLGRRMAAGEGLAMVPARISEDGKELELFFGEFAPKTNDETWPVPAFDVKTRRWQPKGGVMYAAWLRCYRANGRNPDGPCFDAEKELRCSSNGERPRHKSLVAVVLEKVKYSRGPIKFDYWSVVSIDPISTGNSRINWSAFKAKRPFLGDCHTRITTGAQLRAVGYVCISGQNIKRKHDERLFFVPEGVECRKVPIQQEWLKNWANLVNDYRKHAEVPRSRRKSAPDDAYLGGEPGKTAFSRHVQKGSKDEILRPGDLCYARYDTSGKIIGLYPVMISRDVNKLAPQDLLPKELQPATSLNVLSSGDRVFGWVDQAGGRGRKGIKRACKGQLRIASLHYVRPNDHHRRGPEPFTRFRGNGLPLAVLSTPKPEQARFYVAKNKEGEPQENRDKAVVAYDYGTTGPAQSPKGLRGRKVYPHHSYLSQFANEYWDGPAAFNEPSRPIDHQGRSYFREFVRQERMQDDQNRSIEGWINPGVLFRGEIEVTNLSTCELGALLYLLTPEGEPCHLRLGGAKPLGFGSVTISLAGLDISEGSAIRESLRAISPEPRVGAMNLELGIATVEQIRNICAPMIKAFTDAVEAEYGDGPGSFAQIRFINAFLRAGRGFDDGKAVHYPRAGGPNWQVGTPIPPNAEGKNFEWFVANDRDGGKKQALDALWDPHGLLWLSVDDGKFESAPASRRGRR